MCVCVWCEHLCECLRKSIHTFAQKEDKPAWKAHQLLISQTNTFVFINKVPVILQHRHLIIKRHLVTVQMKCLSDNSYNYFPAFHSNTIMCADIGATLDISQHQIPNPWDSKRPLHQVKAVLIQSVVLGETRMGYETRGRFHRGCTWLEI